MRVGVDIGGSGIRAGVVDNSQIAALLRSEGEPTSVDDVATRVRGLVGGLGEVAAVGVGVPGFVRDGVVLGSPNLPFLAGVDLRTELVRALGVEVVVVNDANAAALGAWAESDTRDDLLVLTLGTGVGGGVILHERLHVGASQTAAELGHIRVGGNVLCGCGARGCLETWCGTRGLLARARAMGQHPADGEALVAAAEAGEVWAQMLLHESANALGQGLRTLLNMFGPPRVMITGGLAAAEVWLRPGAEAVLQREGIPANTAHVQFEWRVGAASWAIVGAARALERP